MKAYSILSHQAMIDAVWVKDIMPILEKRFPGATFQQIKEAHAYAYGGAIMPDMGYYPLGSKFFSNLVHYVRTGDFTRNLLTEAKTRNELAFALGALAHYYGDIHGHKLATNQSVPLVYPKVRKKFGDVVTYEEDPIAHMRMEFGFDVLQAARGNYAPEVFRDFVGFKISNKLLERAFYKTYGLRMHQIFIYLPLAERIFKFSVKAFFPQITKISWQWVSDDVKKNKGNSSDEKIAHLLRKSSFKELIFDQQDKPGVSARVMAAALRFAPKIGPLKPLKFKIPNPEAESLFATSFEASLHDYQLTLQTLPEKIPDLHDYDLDTGVKAHLGEYTLADQTFSRLLLKLANNDFESTSDSLRADGLDYFASLPPPPDYRLEKKQYRRTKASLQNLQKSQGKK